MVSVFELTAMTKVFSPTVIVPGVCPQPAESWALQLAVSVTAIWFRVAPKGTYKVRVAGLSTGEPGLAPTVIVGVAVAQPAMCAALHVATLITETLPDASEA